MPLELELPFAMDQLQEPWGGLAIGVTGILYVFVSPIVAGFDIELKIRMLYFFV